MFFLLLLSFAQFYTFERSKTRRQKNLHLIFNCFHNFENYSKCTAVLISCLPLVVMTLEYLSGCYNLETGLSCSHLDGTTQIRLTMYYVVCIFGCKSENFFLILQRIYVWIIWQKIYTRCGHFKLTDDKTLGFQLEPN